ncbi:MAG: response regulator transcription factor [Chloroflexi bacterium]|nr:response regulator transcription factor [Chloroflexota bacterium]
MSQDTSNIRLLIVEDHTVVRAGLRLLLQGAPEIEVIDDTEFGEHALKIVQERAPDVVLLDLFLETSHVTGHEVLEAIAMSSPATRVVVLTAYPEEELVIAALRAGAIGYLLKNAQPTEVIEAVRDASQGRYHIAPEVTRRIVERLLEESERNVTQPADILTPREQEILPLLARGLSNREIADKLVISPATVKTHVSNILDKLGLKDRTRVSLWMAQHQNPRHR